MPITYREGCILTYHGFHSRGLVGLLNLLGIGTITHRTQALTRSVITIQMRTAIEDGVLYRGRKIDLKIRKLLGTCYMPIEVVCTLTVSLGLLM